MHDGDKKTATIYRMVMKDHLCPFGVKAVYLLQREGYKVDDHWLRTPQETEAFKAKHEVKTTPQIFIDGMRIGGYDELRRYCGKPVHDPSEPSYQPILAVFGVAALLALAATWVASGTLFTWRSVEWAVTFSMAILAVLKLRDLESFSNMFLGYDLLARKWVPYAYAYPFGECLAAVLMTAGVLPWLSGPVALFIGTIGAVSVIYTVYIQKRELKCACVGGDSNVPLGPVSLLENLLMVGMGLMTLAPLLRGE
jgi:glutaredoxin